jgi:hypothetical protein
MKRLGPLKHFDRGTIIDLLDISFVDWAQQSSLLPEDGDRIQSPKRFF